MKKEIPTRNYFICLVVSILVIIIVLYLRAFYINYELSNTETSYFSYKKVNEITMSDFNFIINETTNNIILVSNNNYNDLEKKLYRKLKKNDLLDKVLYFDVSNVSNYKSILNSKFDYMVINNKLPILIVIEDGEATNVINVNDDFIDSDIINELLEIK